MYSPSYISLVTFYLKIEAICLSGRLRKTPRRIATWGREFDNDSGPEITWDNNSPSPTKMFEQCKFYSLETRDSVVLQVYINN